MSVIESPRTIRQSLIAAAASCPARAGYAVLDRRSTPGDLAAIGTVFHRWVHRCVKHMAAEQSDGTEPGMPVELGMLYMAEECAQADVPIDEMVPLSMRQMKQLRILAAKWCSDMSHHVVIEALGKVEHRMSVDMEIPGPGGTRYKRTVTGQIDLWMAFPAARMVRILDHKSGWKRPTQPRDGELSGDGEQLEDDAWTQSTVYSLLVLLTMPSVQTVEFYEWAVMWGEYRYRIVQRSELERLVDLTAASVAALDRLLDSGLPPDRWPAMAGNHCAMCAGARHCYTRMVSGVPTSEAEALEAYTVWRSSEQRRKVAAAGLKVYIDANGPLELPSGKVLGWDLSGGRKTFGEFMWVEPEVLRSEDAPPPVPEPVPSGTGYVPPTGDDVPF